MSNAKEWIEYVREFRTRHPDMPYKEALKAASIERGGPKTKVITKQSGSGREVPNALLRRQKGRGMDEDEEVAQFIRLSEKRRKELQASQRGEEFSGGGVFDDLIGDKAKDPIGLKKLSDLDIFLLDHIIKHRKITQDAKKNVAKRMHEARKRKKLLIAVTRVGNFIVNVGLKKLLKTVPLPDKVKNMAVEIAVDIKREECRRENIPNCEELLKGVKTIDDLDKLGKKVLEQTLKDLDKELPTNFLHDVDVLRKQTEQGLVGIAAEWIITSTNGFSEAGYRHVYGQSKKDIKNKYDKSKREYLALFSDQELADPQFDPDLYRDAKSLRSLEDGELKRQFEKDKKKKKKDTKKVEDFAKDVFGGGIDGEEIDGEEMEGDGLAGDVARWVWGVAKDVATIVSLPNVPALSAVKSFVVNLLGEKGEPMNLDAQAQLHANIASTGHTNPDKRPADVGGYKYVREKSALKHVIYVNNLLKHVIISYRGTNPDISSKDGREDLTDDKAIVNGRYRDRPRWKEALQIYDDTKKSYPGFRISIGSHSLGGNITAYVVRNRPNVIGFTFNAGFAPFDNINTKNVQGCKVSFTDYCKRLKNFHIEGDTISLTETYGTRKTFKPTKNTSPHSLSHFATIKGSGMTGGDLNKLLLGVKGSKIIKGQNLKLTDEEIIVVATIYAIKFGIAILDQPCSICDKEIGVQEWQVAKQKIIENVKKRYGQSGQGSSEVTSSRKTFLGGAIPDFFVKQLKNQFEDE